MFALSTTRKLSLWVFFCPKSQILLSLDWNNNEKLCMRCQLYSLHWITNCAGLLPQWNVRRAWKPIRVMLESWGSGPAERGIFWSVCCYRRVSWWVRSRSCIVCLRVIMLISFCALFSRWPRCPVIHYSQPSTFGWHSEFCKCPFYCMHQLCIYLLCMAFTSVCHSFSCLPSDVVHSMQVSRYLCLTSGALILVIDEVISACPMNIHKCFCFLWFRVNWVAYAFPPLYSQHSNWSRFLVHHPSSLSKFNSFLSFDSHISILILLLCPVSHVYSV